MLHSHRHGRDPLFFAQYALDLPQRGGLGLLLLGGQGLLGAGAGVQRIQCGAAVGAGVQMFLYIGGGLLPQHLVVVQRQQFPHQVTGQFHVNSSLSLVFAR